MSEEDHGSLPDGGVEQHDLHGPPLLLAEGGGGGLRVAEGQASWYTLSGVVDRDSHPEVSTTTVTWLIKFN